MEFTELRRKLILKEFSRMNDVQKRAVFNINGATLILAGAGSGKTTVLVNRIAYMIKYGNAYESSFTYRVPTEADCKELEALIENGGEPSFNLKHLLSVDAPKPWQILAITFTIITIYLTTHFTCISIHTSAINVIMVTVSCETLIIHFYSSKIQIKELIINSILFYFLTLILIQQ